MKPAISVIAIAALALTGCSSTPTATPTLSPRATYDDVVQLCDAAAAAGFSCPSWEQGNKVTLAATSGTCSTSDVLMVFLTQDAVQQIVTKAKERPGARTWLVGEHWIVNAPDTEIEKLQPVLGGRKVKFT